MNNLSLNLTVSHSRHHSEPRNTFCNIIVVICDLYPS